MLVLIVDDNAVFRVVVGKLLTQMEMLFIEGLNGMDGLRKYKEHSPNMVITDVQMPLMDGPEMGAEIKRGNPRCPIIYMTADDLVPANWGSFKDPFSEVIKKPNTADHAQFYTELMFKIRKLERKVL